jgi:hypothetical protein
MYYLLTINNSRRADDLPDARQVSMAPAARGCHDRSAQTRAQSIDREASGAVGRRLAR